MEIKEKDKKDAPAGAEGIFVSNQVKHLIMVCKRLKEVKDGNISEGAFLKYMLANIQAHRTIVLVALEKKEVMEGCVVLTTINSLEGVFLWLDFVWVAKHKENLGKEILEATEKIAKELGITRIAGRVTRGLEGAEKKYGFKECYRVIDKEVKQNG